MTNAIPSCRRLLRHLTRFPASLARFIAGSRIAISTARMPMTTNSSTKVNPTPPRADLGANRPPHLHRTLLSPTIDSFEVNKYLPPPCGDRHRRSPPANVPRRVDDRHLSVHETPDFTDFPGDHQLPENFPPAALHFRRFGQQWFSVLTR